MEMPPSHFSGDTVPYWTNIKISSPSGASIPLKVDVCVIGGGIAGLSTAYMCAKEGLSVCVLTSGPLAGGQTSRTTAHLSYVMDKRFQDLIRTFGEDKATRITESHQIAIDQIESIIHNEKIDCEFSRLNGYLFLSPEQSLQLLESELTACYKVGIQNVELLNDYQDLAIGPALKFPQLGQFHPLKYIDGLIKPLESMGVTIHPHVRVEEVRDGDPCEIKTSEGKVVRASSVVVATNTPINDRFAIHTKQAPYRTYAIAVPIPKNSVHKALFWDTGEPYHYLRLQKGYGDIDILIVGGEDHKTGQDDQPNRRFDYLEDWTQRKFPFVKPAIHKWSGQVWESIDSLAYIGRNPGDKNVYIATGDCGQGMTYGTIAGMLITDLIQGRFNPWQFLYEPSRKPLSFAVEFLRENINVADQYLEYLRPSPVDEMKGIEPGAGAVIQDGINKVAVYRSERGEFTRLSAACPHLGGVVHWNAVEKSWDCPCHGSRFNVKGEPITGPANSCLKPWDEQIHEDRSVAVSDRDISVSGLTH